MSDALQGDAAPRTSGGVTEIANQVMWNRLIAVVEEQAQALVRTAFSTSVREAGDLSAGIFDKRGRMLAQAVTGTPGHVNAMAEAVAHFIREIGEENIFEHDVYLTNDPWKGTGHLHDITVVTPAFRGGQLIGYFASTAHVVDIGGRGFGPDAFEVYEEGLLIPIMKFAERGRVNDQLINIIKHNARQSDMVVGDIYSLAACNETGQNRLMEMCDEFELSDIDALAEFILERSLTATRARISALGDAEARNRMRVDGYDDPIDLVVCVKITDGQVHANYDGTSSAVKRGINVPLIYTKAYTCYGLKCAIAPEIPNNAGSLAPFIVDAPKGCILNALHPAPVSVRHVTGQFLPDVVLGALDQILPDGVPAEGASALWNIHISARPVTRSAKGDQQDAEILSFNSGGTGARPGLDGLSATAFPSGVHTMSVEATEHVGPVVFWRKELRPNSGGSGQYRGGLGQTIEIAPAQGYAFYFNAMFDRVAYPARGRRGGLDGRPGSVRLNDGTPMKTKGRQFVPENQRLVLELPGGGGHGDPNERDAASLARDIECGYVSTSDSE